VEAIDRIHKQLSNLARGVGMTEWHKMRVLSEFVHNHEDAIESIGNQQSIDEIHRGNFPRARRNWKRL
jgi:hypothetical protein